jgi:hypothetical protein
MYIPRNFWFNHLFFENQSKNIEKIPLQRAVGADRAPPLELPSCRSRERSQIERDERKKDGNGREEK